MLGHKQTDAIIQSSNIGWILRDLMQPLLLGEFWITEEQWLMAEEMYLEVVKVLVMDMHILPLEWKEVEYFKELWTLQQSPINLDSQTIDQELLMPISMGLNEIPMVHVGQAEFSKSCLHNIFIKTILLSVDHKIRQCSTNSKERIKTKVQMESYSPETI